MIQDLGIKLEKELLRTYILELFKPEEYNDRAYNDAGNRLIAYLNGWYGLLNAVMVRGYVDSEVGKEAKSIFNDTLQNNSKGDFITDINYKMTRLADKYSKSVTEAKISDMRFYIPLILQVAAGISAVAGAVKLTKELKLSYDASRLYKYTKEVIIDPKLSKLINNVFDGRVKTHDQLSYQFRKIVDDLILMYPSYRNTLIHFKG